jgi:hypothetical protein
MEKKTVITAQEAREKTEAAKIGGCLDRIEDKILDTIKFGMVKNRADITDIVGTDPIRISLVMEKLRGRGFQVDKQDGKLWVKW